MTRRNPDTLMEEALSAAREIFGARAKAQESLARHCTFRVGGPADVWITVTTEDELSRLMSLAAQREIPLLLIGNGTNTLFADAGARGVVAHVGIEHFQLRQLDEERAELRVGAGVSMPELVKKLTPLGWAGLEWSVGVPGTVGGAVVSNAGAQGGCVADTLIAVRTLLAPDAEGGLADRVIARELPATELRLGYRQSRFRAHREVTFADDGRIRAQEPALIEPGEVIVEAVFNLRHDDPAQIAQRSAAYLEHRRQTQPPSRNGGSVFKNPEPQKSGKLIEDAGLKPYRIGGAEISAKHANFIVTQDGAQAADVAALIALARRTVRERFGVDLELEVEPRGDW